MQDWERFEHECCEYLQARYASKSVVVEEFGRSDSTKPDLVVHGRRDVAVETKMARAQSGQFVVSYDSGEDTPDEFVVSEACAASTLQAPTAAILAVLNADTERYLDLLASQNWAPIEAPEQGLAEWIEDHYRRTKGEEWLMAGHIGGGKMLVPMGDLSRCFRVGAVIRHKPSGTNPLPAYDEANVQRLLDEHARYLTSTGKYGPVTAGRLRKEGKHYHVPLVAGIDRGDRYFGHEAYYLSPAADGHYRAKRRGRTNNISVVFTLDLRPEAFRPGTGFEALDALVL